MCVCTRVVCVVCVFSDAGGVQAAARPLSLPVGGGAEVRPKKRGGAIAHAGHTAATGGRTRECVCGGGGGLPGYKISVHKQ